MMTKLNSILKNRDITLLTKVYIVKDMIFLVVMYGCDSQTIMKAECQRTDLFEKTLCWERSKVGGEVATEDEMAGWHHQLNGHESE